MISRRRERSTSRIVGAGVVRSGRHSVPLLLGGVLVLYFLSPFVAFLTRSTSSDVLSGLSDPATLSAIRTSFLTAPIATALATIFGLPLAYVLSRSSFRGKRLVEAAVLAPLVLPPIVGGAMLLTVLGQYTPIGAAAAGLGVPLTGSIVGIVLAQTFVAAPFLVVTARAGFDAVDPQLEEAARTLGYGPLATARRVSLPIAAPAIAAGVVLTFVRAIGEFGATLVVASSPRTMPVQLWYAFQMYGVDAIVPLTLVLLAITMTIVVAVGAFADRPPEH